MPIRVIFSSTAATWVPIKQPNSSSNCWRGWSERKRKAWSCYRQETTVRNSSIALFVKTGPLRERCERGSTWWMVDSWKVLLFFSVYMHGRGAICEIYCFRHLFRQTTSNPFQPLLSTCHPLIEGSWFVDVYVSISIGANTTSFVHNLWTWICH